MNHMKTCGDLARAGHPGFVEHDLFRQHPGDAAMCYCCEEDPEPVREHGKSFPRGGYDDQACREPQIKRYGGELVRMCCLCADSYELEEKRGYRVVNSGTSVDLQEADGAQGKTAAFREARKLAGWGAGS